MAKYFKKTQLMTNRSKGFTLIEIMITIAIIGIITATAWPSYERYQQKGRRADGISALLQQSATLEKCFINYGVYNNANCTLLTQSERGYYTITPTPATALGADSYTLTATPAGAQTGDGECATLTLTHLGVKGFTGSANSSVKRCWSQ